MPIPPPSERPDLYDYMDCRPGPSTYPAAQAAAGREMLRQRLLANPALRHLAERLAPIGSPKAIESGSSGEGSDADPAA